MPRYGVDLPLVFSAKLSMGNAIGLLVLHLLHLSAHVIGYGVTFISAIVFKDLMTLGQVHRLYSIQCLVTEV